MADEGRADLVSTTDCLEAVSVLKGWKNFFFVIILICLVLLQVSFWVVDTNMVEPNSVPKVEKTTPIKTAEAVAPAVITLAAVVESNAVEEPNSAVDPNAAAKAKSGGRSIIIPQIKFEHVAWFVRVCNFVLLVTTVMYCLTVLFCVKVSLVGRLGGINHIMRAFFLSLVVLVLLLPWQRYFGDVVTGWMFTPGGIIASKNRVDQDHSVLNIALYYVRYAGLWVVLTAFVVMAQMRTVRWAKATMRRLGVL